MKKVIFIIIIIAVAFGAIRVLKIRKERLANATPPQPPTINITLATPKEGEATKSERFMAKVESQANITISTKLSGYIEEIYVVESQKVSEGEELVKIDNRDILASLKTLNATLIQQQKDYKLTQKIDQRNIKLNKKGALSQEQLDSSSLQLLSKETQMISTKEKIAQLKTSLEYLDIKAPFDGVVGSILKKRGSLASPNQPIITISQIDQKLTFSFASTPIKKSQIVKRDGVQIGEIKSIYTQSKNGLSVAEVSLCSPIEGVSEGSLISIDIIVDRQKGCLIPTDSILYTQDRSYIVEYDESRFNKREVEILLENHKETLISSCPKYNIAQGSQSKLSKLGFYNRVRVGS
jgi:RND family efflux transporter MFP subunit